MGPNDTIHGVRDGATVELPQGLDAIFVNTAQGTICIDLGSRLENAVLLGAMPKAGDAAAELTFSRLPSGRTAVSVAQTRRNGRAVGNAKL